MHIENDLKIRRYNPFPTQVQRPVPENVQIYCPFDDLRSSKAIASTAQGLIRVKNQSSCMSKEENSSDKKELKLLLALIKDAEFKSALETFYKSDKDRNLKATIQLADCFNNLQNVYTTLVLPYRGIPFYKEYLDFCRQKNIDVQSENSKYRYEDFLEEQRVEPLVDFCEYNDSELSDFLYKKFYLENKKLPTEIKNTCAEIAETYGTKLFLPASFDDKSDNLVEFVKQELEAWAIASRGYAKYPPVIDLLGAKRSYVDKERVNGTSFAIAFCETQGSNSIFLDGYKEIKNSLRHELSHVNDKKDLAEFPQNWYDNDGKSVLPSVKEKFGAEFQKGGIKEKHINYAFSSPSEFIAVAIEGDMSKYSPEFVEQLKDFGMPEWATRVNLHNPIS